MSFGHGGILMIWQILGAFVAVVGFSLILEVPKKYIFYVGAVAALGWFIYLVLIDVGQSVYVSNFWAAMVISIGAQVMSRILKTPVTMFNIPGIMPLVPGAGMYRIVYYVIHEESKLVSFYLSQTLQIAAVISMAIFIVDAVFRLFLRKTK